MRLPWHGYAIVFFGLLLLPGVMLGQDQVLSGTTTPAGFRVSMQSLLSPLRINQMHNWLITITDHAGQPLAVQTIRVSGGMPLHNHGLPTQPGVTSSPQPGQFLLEGVRFHMPGTWELRLEITVNGQVETVVLPLEL